MFPNHSEFRWFSLVGLLMLSLLLTACGDKKQSGKAPAGKTKSEADQSASGQSSAAGGQQRQQSGSSADVPFPLDSSKLVRHSSGLRYQIIHEGSGEVPQPGQKVIAHYHGTLPNGQVFDSSFEKGKPFNFVLGQGSVIQAWDLAFRLFPVGTQAILIVPPELGYGNQSKGPIPAGSTLRFDVVSLGTAPAPKQQPGGGRRQISPEQLRQLQRQQQQRQLQ